MLYLTGTMIFSVDLAQYGVSLAKDWASVEYGTNRNGVLSGLTQRVQSVDQRPNLLQSCEYKFVSTGKYTKSHSHFISVYEQFCYYMLVFFVVLFHSLELPGKQLPVCAQNKDKTICRLFIINFGKGQVSHSLSGKK